MIRAVCLGRAWQCPCLFNIILSFPPSLTLIKIPMKKLNLQLGINLVLEQPLVGRNPLLIFILCTGCILLKIYTLNHLSWCIVYYSLPVNNPERIRVLLSVCFSILWWLFLRIARQPSGDVHEAFSLIHSLPGSSKLGQEKLNTTKLRGYIYICQLMNCYYTLSILNLYLCI